MIYLLAALNVLTLAAFVYELHESRSERRSLMLLIKSQSVPEFVRAEMKLASPLPDDEEEAETPVDLDEVSPRIALKAIKDANS